MDKRTFAAWAIGLGLLVGAIGAYIFYGPQNMGLNFPLYTAVVAVVFFFLARKVNLPLRAGTIWLLIPLFFFAIMIAIRAEALLTLLNFTFLFLIGGLLAHYLPQRHTVAEDNFLGYISGTIASGIMIFTSPSVQAFHGGAWLRENSPSRHPQVNGVLRGLMFALPVVLVFGVLLSSADAVFGDAITRTLSIIQFDNLGAAFGQLVIIGILGWMACGLFAYGIGRNLWQTTTPTNVGMAENSAETGTEASPSVPVKRPKKQTFILGMTEATTMLVTVNLLFAVFVFIQFAYFFGGDANVNATGFTYAQYARRGFFELVAVSGLVLGLVLWLDYVTVRHSERHYQVFRGLAVLMVLLTGVMLISAWRRLALYEDVYGFTHLRVYTHVFIAWMGVLFGIFLLSLFRLREQIFSIGLLVSIFGYLGTMNVMNVEGFIADRNVDRYLANPAENDLDICYLVTMSSDAAPALVRLYQQAPAGSEARDAAAFWLRERVDSADISDKYDLMSWNLSRSTAWALVQPLQAELGPTNFESYGCSYRDRYEAEF